MDLNPLIMALIALVLIAGAVALVIYGRRHRINGVWAALALLFSGVAMLLCLVGSSAGVVYAKPSGDPRAAVDEFMLALVQGDYDTAYARLKGHSDLGLATPPQSPAAQMVYQALLDSFDYSLEGPCEAELTQAKQKVNFRYLDVAAVTAGLDQATQRQLKAIVKDRDASQVYDDKDQYLPEVTQEAYMLALEKALSQAKSCYVEIQLELSLEYTGGRWMIGSSPELLNALAGGTGI